MITLAAGACATAGAGAKETPIESVASLAGAWTGNINFGSGSTPCTLTIEPSGRAELRATDLTLNATIRVERGVGAYTLAGKWAGSLTLYQDGDKRELELKGRGGVLQALVARK